MHIFYKLIGLSVVFGLVLTEPAAKLTSESFDDLAYDSYDAWNNFVEVVEDNIADETSPAVETVVPKVPKVALISSALKFITKILGLKAKAIALAVVIIKWLLPKTFFIVLGAIATFAFCKLTNKCSLAYDPVVYSYNTVPPQVLNFVTPGRLDEAQQYLMSALQQYAKRNVSK